MKIQSIKLPTKSFALLSASILMSSNASAATIFSDSFESPNTSVTTIGTDLLAPAGYTFIASNIRSNGVFLNAAEATGSDTSGDGVDDQVFRQFQDGSITTTAAQISNTITLGDTATLTFDYGNLGALDSAFPRAGSIRVQLLAIDGIGGETELATKTSTFTVSELLNGLDGDFSLSHVAATNVGERYAFRIQSGTTTGHHVIDNLVMDVTPVPEPSSTALIGLGGLALILRRRK